MTDQGWLPAWSPPASPAGDSCAAVARGERHDAVEAATPTRRQPVSRRGRAR
ncbi:MAG: hypothetical protein M3P83_12650 [Actinomycetota bacterium]|nr:hypothetical protein [Actinomycetota bacterium]